MSNHWLVTERMNMRQHALGRHAAAVKQLSNGTNADDPYIPGNTIQTVPILMSTPGDTAKLGTIHSSIQTTQSSQSLTGSEQTMN